MKSDENVCLGFCLAWIAWWHWEGGESDLAVLTGLIVTRVEWQSISPCWSWPAIVMPSSFWWYFQEQSLPHTSRSTGQCAHPSHWMHTSPTAGAQCLVPWCWQHFLTPWGLYIHSLGSYYLGETKDYEEKKRNRVSIKCRIQNPRLFWSLWLSNTLIVLVLQTPVEIPYAVKSHLHNSNVWEIMKLFFHFPSPTFHLSFSFFWHGAELFFKAGMAMGNPLSHLFPAAQGRSHIRGLAAGGGSAFCN